MPTTMEPAEQFRFSVNAFGETAAGFNQCQGLGYSVEEYEFRGGDWPEMKTKFPGLAEMEQVILIAGKVWSNNFIGFMRKCYNPATGHGSSEYRDTSPFSITVKDRDQKPVATYTIREPYIQVYKLSDLDAGTSGAHTVSLTITHRGLDVTYFK